MTSLMALWQIRKENRRLGKICNRRKWKERTKKTDKKRYKKDKLYGNYKKFLCVDREIKQVTPLKYLGGIFTSDRSSEKEILNQNTNGKDSLHTTEHN